MSAAILERPTYLRRRALGTEAVYEVLSQSGGIVSAAVVSAPGLAPGTRVRLLARVAEAMERLDAREQPYATPRAHEPSAGAVSRRFALR